MKISAAWLLTFLAIITVTNGRTTPTASISTSPFPTTELAHNEANTTTESVKSTQNQFVDIYARPFSNMKDILMQEIRTLDKDVSDDKIQEEVAETLKAEAQRDRTTTKPSKSTTKKVKSAAEDEEFKKFDDAPFDELDNENDEDDYYDENEDDDEDSDLNDDEEVMTQCPDYCKCAGQYAAAMTATCTKLVDEQAFGPGIAHLRIENAPAIQLGPNALRARGLQQLESIAIVDTEIVDLDRTAFNGLTYLFAVNLTRNNLHDIHPNTFQNNTQLSLLTISGNILKHMHDTHNPKSTKHYLLHASSITDFDFSNNGILRLKRTAFSKMHSLSYINLRGNRLREIDNAIFDSLDSLMEVDLSDNILNELPLDLFIDKEIQALRVAGNNISTLATISASKLTTLDASRNKIRVIAKEDLDGVPLLDTLYIKSNNLKKIHQHAFNDLDQLRHLDISDNKLSSLTEHHFKDNPRLQVLLMNDNPTLQTLPVFKTYGMTHNTFSVFRFECANCGLNNLKPSTFDEMPAITRLNLARNRLSDLPYGFLRHLSSLRELDLSNNIISTLQPEMFRGAENLNKLNLANNPLTTLQVTPFLNTPALVKLDVSRCNLERVWSEARVPLKSLRFLSVRGNLLRRITVEELRATPKLSGLDLSHNPLDCDEEFNQALQWLTDRGVTPTETLGYASDFVNVDEDADSKGISQWTDLAKIACDGIDAGPPPRPVPSKSTPKNDFTDDSEESDSLPTNELDKNEELLKINIDHGIHVDDPRLLEDQEYDVDYTITTKYHSWYDLRPNFKIWLVSGTALSVLVIFLLVARIACCLANKRGRGPVLRPPMILRQGLVDNKNCGLVYKPLQEEIATPHMPKRGSFYSSSTFHYDKIVPESV
ncbi:insulin-like growth factor-binding protein complex acid labile subunit [Nylanderia fulva]|uniref:insulin-like growth factor-binding protein complex acid labile subunit n=1 Tax=Nylanderia fulva TaxID=613905 RepID=UPI0010FB8AC9|nr:insulin-like growth factor-binding protein complex acid labile subunit [Nylanderia fulva]XP_029162037.1 insulin-like growth factor-binding protein complex acid labile subunit [Nylanderia fulva]